jgi:hypothetical protein
VSAPVEFSQELADAICEAVANVPRGLDFICETTAGFPDARTVRKWLQVHTAFRDAYSLAKKQQADLLFDECLEIADDSSGDRKVIRKNDGSEQVVLDTEFVARSKLRVDTRLKMAGKLAPKKYGDKLDLNATVGFTKQEDALSELE